VELNQWMKDFYTEIKNETTADVNKAYIFGAKEDDARSYHLADLILQHDINVANIGLVTGISLAIVYSVAWVCAVSIALLVLVNIAQLLRGRDLADPRLSDSV